jgi:drug/metabolite transporter (DMT)-like permease
VDRHSRPYLALGLRLLAQVMVSIMLLLVKIVGERGIALSETLFWRQFVPALCIAAWLLLRRQTDKLKTARPWLHARRAVVGMMTMVMILGVVQVLPLAEATVLSFTTPLFAVLLSVALLREAVGPIRWAAVLLGLGGVAIIAGLDQAEIPLLGLALGLGAAFGGALVAIQLREMSRTEVPLTIVFWFSALGALMLSPSLLLTGAEHSRTDWLLLAGIGVSGLACQIFLTAALRYGTVSSVIVMDYSQLIWAILFGWLFFSQLPPASTWLGAPLIIVAGLLVIWREQRIHRSPGRSPQVVPLTE